MYVLQNIPIWYWIITSIFSVYQFYRGFRYYWLSINFPENNDIKNWKWDKGLVICFQAAYLYGICSFVGFITLFTSYNILVSQKLTNSFDTGSAVLIATTFIIGLLGVSGELGQLIQQGKLPTVK